MVRRGGIQESTRRFSTAPLLTACLDEALARSPEGALAVGRDGRIVAWNRAAEAITGYPAAQAIGRTCSDLFAQDARKGVCDPGCPLTALGAETLKTVDVPTRTRAGRRIWLNMTAVAVPLDGADAVAVHLLRDVTATRELLALMQQGRGQQDDSGAAAPAGHVTLTRRELQVLSLVGQGLGTAAAAERLDISPMTIRNHVQNILGKLGVHSRLQAVAYAMRHQLL